MINKLKVWNDLNSYKATNVDVEELYLNPFDNMSMFMKRPHNYGNINKIISNINNDVNIIYNEYCDATVTEVIKNKDQLKLARLSDSQKQMLQTVIETNKLPNSIDDSFVRAVNELFKNIKIVSLNKAKVITSVFGNNDLVTLRQMETAFFDLVEKIKKENKGEEIRIKIEE